MAYTGTISVKNELGVALPGIGWTLRDQASVLITSGNTDANGLIQLSNVADGDYLLFVNYPAASPSRMRLVIQAPVASLKAIIIKAVPAAPAAPALKSFVISVYEKAGGANPLAGALVSLRKADGSLWASKVTPTNGIVAIAAYYPPGVTGWTVTAEKAGYAGVTLPIEKYANTAGTIGVEPFDQTITLGATPVAGDPGA